MTPATRYTKADEIEAIWPSLPLIILDLFAQGTHDEEKGTANDSNESAGEREYCGAGFEALSIMKNL